MSFRRAALLLTALALASSALSAAFALPAEAAKPKVGLVQGVAASTTSITITWPKVKKATRYQVIYAGNFAMKKAKTKSVGKRTRYTLRGLTRGKEYCMVVRVTKGKSRGARSARYCKPTLVTAGTTSGTRFTAMTYNVCSDKGRCGATWPQRQPYAAKLVASRQPDVVGVQEANAWPRIGQGLAPYGYSEAVYDKGKAIYYKTSSFDLVARSMVTECADVETHYRTPYDLPFGNYDYALDDLYPVPAGENLPDDIHFDDPQYGEWWRPKPFDPNRKDTDGRVGYWSVQENCWTYADGYQTGVIYLGWHDGDRFAVWAVLRSKKTGRNVLVVSAHTSPGKGKEYDKARRGEVRRLIASIDASNTQKLPVVYLGDFNSHKNRELDGPGEAFKAAGYVDAFDNATSLTRPNFNSYNDFRRKPITSNTYGDHVDHIYVKPGVGVSGWESVATFRGAKYDPLPSDHNPVRATLTVR